MGREPDAEARRARPASAQAAAVPRSVPTVARPNAASVSVDDGDDASPRTSDSRRQPAAAKGTSMVSVVA